MTETAVPEKIGKYQIDRLLGQGAMGVVYQATDPRIGRQVAIKAIHRHLLEQEGGDSIRDRFDHEMKAVGQLVHPNIVGIFDSDELDDQGVTVPYFVMEFVKGKGLDAYLKAGERFSCGRAIELTLQILDAFEFVHARGIVHRDIKPANIFLTEEGIAKIADFGIARIEDSELTQVGTVMGTPNYMSPEQCAGQTLDLRSDLFSIGIVFYELLTGEKPFSGNSMHAVMHKIVNSMPEQPSALNPAVPAALDAVLFKALSKQPDQRFQSALEFKQAIEQAAAGGSSEATVVIGNTNPAASLAVPGSVAGDNTALAETQQMEAGQTVNGAGKAGYLAGAAAVLLLLAGGIAWFALQPGGSESAANTAPLVQNPSSQSAAVENANQPVAQISASAEQRLSAEQQDKLAKLLRLAALNEKTGRVIWPPTSNAVDVYRLALDIDPQNPEARNSLQRIADEMFEKAESLQKKGDIETLNAHLEASLSAFPEDQRFKGFK